MQTRGLKMLRRLALLTTAIAVGLSAAAQAAPTIQSYPIPGVKDISEGPDNNVWVTQPGSDKILKVVSGDPPAVTPFNSVAVGPTYITTGPDGNLWYGAGAAVGRMTPAGAAVQFTYAGIGPIGALNLGGVVGIAPGPDGKVWIVDAANDRVVRLNTDGTKAAAPNPIPLGAGFGGRQIAPGPDGNMYVAGSDQSARITMAGTVTPFPNAGGGQQQDIVAGPDGNMWAASTTNASRLTTGGVFTNFAQPGTDTFGAAAGPDGAVWMSQFATRTVARVAPDGAITKIGPTTLSPRYIARNRNTNEMWFVADTANPDTGIGVVRGIDIPTAGGAPVPPGTTPPAGDTTKPVLSSLLVSVKSKKKTVSFTLSEQAKVTLKYQRKTTGRKVKGKCKAGAKKGKRCSLFKPAGTQQLQGKQGKNTAGLLPAVQRKPGSYRVTATAVDGAGNISLPATKSFKIVQAKKKR